MAYKVLALDIDGTLTNSKKQITKRTKEAVALAGFKGCEDCYCVRQAGAGNQGICR